MNILSSPLSLPTLAAGELSTPAYVYDLAALRARVDELRGAFDVPDMSLLFATMANDRDEILRALACKGVGACVNSPYHLKKALAVGMERSRIQFTSTGLSADILQTVFDSGIALNIDSPHQAEQWFSGTGARRGGMRINTAALTGADAEHADRIGSDPGALPQMLAIAARHGSVIDGLHIYMGTNFLSVPAMREILEPFFVLAAQVPDLHYVNIGGGIGVDYARSGASFDIASYGAAVSGMVRALSAVHGRPIRLLFEPGRGMVASSGVFVTRVTDVKRLNGRKYVGVDGSIAVFPRPFHNPETPHVVHCLGENAGETESGIVVGCTTFSRDILARAPLPRDIGVGDLLVFEDAGAYCNSMTSRFLGQPEPSSIFLNGAEGEPISNPNASQCPRPA